MASERPAAPLATPAVRLFRFTFAAMASEHELQLAAIGEGPARSIASAAIAEVRRIEAKYSRYREDSVVARINRCAGGAPVPIDAETHALLAYADQCHRTSGGRFDLTSGILRRAWEFGRTPPRLPSPDLLASLVARVDWSRVEWSARSIRLPEPGMEVDFGGIGKEYAADRAATLCVEHGARHALVNLGGDVRAVGGRPDGSAWRVGVRDPCDPAGTLASVQLIDQAVATSGDYVRFIEVDGRRYGHILDARTGWPVQRWRSVSVVAPVCVAAGSCATIAMLLGADAPAFLDTHASAWFAVAIDGARFGTTTDRTTINPART